MARIDYCDPAHASERTREFWRKTATPTFSG